MRGFKRFVRSNWQFHVFLLIPVIYTIMFHYIPLLGGGVLAFKDYSIRDGIFASPWVGFRYFNQFFSSPHFFRLIGNTLALSFWMLILGMPLPILLAIALNEVGNQRFKKFVQTLTYAPYFISTVIMVAMIFSFLDPRIGIINQLLQNIGIPAQNYMAYPSAFRPIYVLSGLWQFTGYNAIIYIAALSGIDPNLYEAAKVDGASRLKRILNVDLPCILPTIIVILILEAGKLMNVGFEKVFLMQNNLNLSVSEIISTYVYKMGLVNAQYSFSTAVGLFNSTVNLIIVLAVNKLASIIGERGIW